MKLRIIIFEDDPEERQTLAGHLLGLGHEVLAFADPMACPLYWDDSCRCDKESPCGDLLIADNRMPRMTGLEFIRRQCERGCKGVVDNKALISGAWTEGQLREARRLGCRVFVKPLVLDELDAWIEERARVIACQGRQPDLRPFPSAF